MVEAPVLHVKYTGIFLFADTIFLIQGTKERLFIEYVYNNLKLNDRKGFFSATEKIRFKKSTENFTSELVWKLYRLLWIKH